MHGIKNFSFISFDFNVPSSILTKEVITSILLFFEFFSISLTFISNWRDNLSLKSIEVLYSSISAFDFIESLKSFNFLNCSKSIVDGSFPCL